jgi:hypothetical protein
MDNDLDYDTKSLMEARVLLSVMSKVLYARAMQLGCPEDVMGALKKYEEYVKVVKAHGQ